LSAPAVAAAKRNYSLDIFHGTLHDARFADETFDVVAMFHVIEHLPDPRSVLREARRILKRNGVLIAEVPHPTGFDARMSKELLESIMDYPHHVQLFPPAALRELFVEAGFEVVSLKPSFSFFFSRLLMKNKQRQEGGVSAIEMPPRAAGIPRHGWKAKIKEMCAMMASGMKLTIVARRRI